MDPIQTATTAAEALKFGIEMYKKGSEAIEKVRTPYGNLGFYFTLILEFHEAIPHENINIPEILKKLGGTKDGKIFKVNLNCGELIIYDIIHEETNEIDYEDLLEIIGVSLPEQDLEERFGELLDVSILFIISTSLYAFLRTAERNSISATYNFLDSVSREIQLKVPVKKSIIFLRIRSEDRYSELEELKSKIEKKFDERGVSSTVSLERDSHGIYIKIRLTNAIQAEIIENILFEGIFNKIKKKLSR